MQSLEKELRGAQEQIRGHASDFELDFFEVIFELLDWDQMNAVAAYGGFPNRYPHWRWGMEYERLSKTYEYGFSKIYEMVINNNPCYAYLMRANSLVDQKMVMAHVYGHSDFFKNNVYFANTNRKMVDEAGNHRSKIQRLMLRHGVEPVEDFIDLCLSLENLIDVHAPMRVPFQHQEVESDPGKPVPLSHPEKDTLLHLLEKAPLEDWQQDALAIIREEAYYFVPQAMTKIMNEGWASYVHSTLMTQKILDDSEVIDYAARHASTLSSGAGSLNPYKVGLELFRDIEERWDTGRFGKEYEECDDLEAKEHWDRQIGQGRQKIFEIRKLYDDVNFIDAFLTPEFCEAHKLFTYVYDPKNSQYEIQSRDYAEVKKKLLQQLTNGGNPIVELTHDNYNGRGELYLRHLHEGIDLRLDYSRETLKALYKIWKKPVHLETRVDDLPRLFSFDGEEQKEQRLSEND